MHRFQISFYILLLICFCNCFDNSQDVSENKTPKYNTLTVTDIDNNIYHTINIGTQTWFVENLKTTKYNDGERIPNVSDRHDWYALQSGAYCNYYNTKSYGDTYGKLYNGYAVNTKKLCPKGWHVPSEDVWRDLTDRLGDGLYAGGKLKEYGTKHWKSPNKHATNETGFTGLPGGRRIPDMFALFGEFSQLETFGYWWSSTKGDHLETNWIHCLNSNNGLIDRDDNSIQNAYSCRCIMD